MMRRLVFVWLMLLSVTARADYSDHRNRKVDSLEQVLHSGQALSDEQRILAHRDLMWGYLQTDGKRAEANARQVLAMSYGHDMLNLRTDALRILGMIAYGDERYDEALWYYDWALAVTDTMQTRNRYSEKDIDDNLSSLYGAIGNLYNIQDKALLAIEYYQKAAPIFEKNNWRESLTILHHNIAELYQSMGNNEEAKQQFFKNQDSVIVAVSFARYDKYEFNMEGALKGNDFVKAFYEWDSKYFESNGYKRQVLESDLTGQYIIYRIYGEKVNTYFLIRVKDGYVSNISINYTDKWTESKKIQFLKGLI